MKKILIDLERLRYPNSGISNVFRNLAEGIQKQHHDFDFYFFGKRNELTKISRKINIIDWKPWHKFYENFSQKFDIVHASHQLSSYFHKDYKNAIKILTLHDLNFLYETMSYRKRQKMLKKVNQNLKNTDYIVCISEFVRQDVLKNRAILNLDSIKEIFVVHNGIAFPKDKTYDLGEYRYLEQKKYILNIGVLFEKKNQKSLVQMLPFLDRDLVLIASSEKEPYAGEVMDCISELNLTDRVHILKNVSEQEKYALIQNCEAMCHPSLAEGFGIPPLEAMVFGKPVFLSKLTSLPEIGGEAAFYFENFIPELMAKYYLEKMCFFHQNKTVLEQKIKNQAAKYEKSKMVEGYLDIYHRVLKNASGVSF